MGNGRQVSHKTVAKSLADGVVPGPNVVELAILVVYMRRINYNSATVNISVFIKQRNISFQKGISLKTMRLGSLVVRKK